jgi:hypothetical protein
MRGTTRTHTAAGLGMALLLALALLAPQLRTAAAQTSGGHTVYAVTADNQLVRFASNAPGALGAALPIGGLQPGESILGIDFRPATGQLFALGSTSRLYVLDPSTGAATQVGAGSFALPLAGAEFGFDFNPTVDRIRVVSDAGQNLRLNPNTGAVVDADTGADGVQPDGDLNGVATGLVAAGYINNFPSATTTALYGIDADLDLLVLQSPPNNGTTVFAGALGVDIDAVAGFDIVSSGNQAFAALTPSGETTSRWYTVDLASGVATEVGALGAAIMAIAIEPPAPEMVYALTSSNRLLSFSSGAPGTITGTVAVSGLQEGEELLAIDFRPATGELYGVGSTSRLYAIDTLSGAAMLVGTQPLSPTLAGEAFGLDFNPTVDRIRAVSDAEQNLRLNPNNSAAIVDGPLAYGGGDPNEGADPRIAAAGYTNNFSGTTTTALFVIDAELDILALQNPPNNGTLETVGPLGVDVTDELGFDITRDGVAYVAFNPAAGGASRFGAIDIATGAIADLGAIGGGEVIRDLAVPTWGEQLFLPVVFR